MGPFLNSEIRPRRAYVHRIDQVAEVAQVAPEIVADARAVDVHGFKTALIWRQEGGHLAARVGPTPRLQRHDRTRRIADDGNGFILAGAGDVNARVQRASISGAGHSLRD